MNVTAFALTTMFKIISSFLHSLFPIPEKSQNDTQDEITVHVKKTESNSKSLVNNFKLKLKRFDSNLQYKDTFKKIKIQLYNTPEHFIGTLYFRKNLELS